MQDIQLVFPNPEMESAALAFKQEFYDHGEKTINGSYKFDNEKYSYGEWLEIIHNNLDPEKYNPKFGFSHTLFAVNDSGRIVGIINFRHAITDFYRDSGHIGYSVRPSERNKGYATEMLRQVLEIAKRQGLSEVYITCKKSNEASRKTIIQNCGVLKREFEKDAIAYEEYLITL